MKLRSMDDGAARTMVLVFDEGDEVMHGLRRVARDHGLTAARFTGIGALEHVVLGYFAPDRRRCERIPLDEQVEVLALTGSITQGANGLEVHAHIVVGRSDGAAAGGHLIEGRVRPTLELVLTEMTGQLVRREDQKTGLTLIDLGVGEERRDPGEARAGAGEDPEPHAPRPDPGREPGRG